ncbi:MAG: tRNA uridine-5-carboxymethylaminomethyl(34) synthesis GTPase MnmE [Lachnospiraceae bacterium]|nr:tRNA uridine-5-carboxymethylaminomethyl(34) synthesis GTPase MnmE [Lachnospiraceae bacterium]
MKYQDTIAAIAVSSKNGSISVIRISGDDSLKIVSEIFFNAKNEKISLESCQTHTIQYGFIQNAKNELLDEVLVLIMKAPRSYTAEDVVEIQCHGGAFICQKILELLVEKGVRIAEPGEFTKRAFLNGRLDLSQAESVMDVIRSKSKVALENSLSQLTGKVKEKIVSLREMILEDIAFLEAALDDPEHISLEDFSSVMGEHTKLLREEVKYLLDNSENGRIIKEGIRTVIVGKPNVGKSSFLNCILRENRAIVTDIPGTTRDTLEEELMIGQTLLHLVDTAGIRNTEDKIESIGIEKAKQSVKEADFVICILDSSEELSEEDKNIFNLMRKKQGIILLNKSDLTSVILPEQIQKMTEKKVLPFSAATGEGLRELEAYLNERFMLGSVSYQDEIYITNMRQKQALYETAESLRNLSESIEAGMPEDLYSIDLYNAYESLGKIIGETVEDDIVDKIFKDFCMGK